MKRILLILSTAVALLILGAASAARLGSGSGTSDEVQAVDDAQRYELVGMVQSVNRAAGYVRIDGKTYMLSKHTVVSAQDRRLASVDKAQDWVGRKASYIYDQGGDNEFILTGIHILGK